jgi:hypothetical protein
MSLMVPSLKGLQKLSEGLVWLPCMPAADHGWTTASDWARLTIILAR